jgi:hypothetical protein
MNLEKLQTNVLAIARANPPSQRVPYGFEQRVMARLRLRPVLDQWAFWARALWQATAPCVAVMLLLIAWALFRPNPASPPSNDLALDLENTLLTAADQEQPLPAEFFW